MHDLKQLEQLLAEWRQTTMAARGAETLDELESHLREAAEELVHSGLTQPEAFQRALKQLGTGPAIASEFQKLDPPTWWPVKVATVVVIMLALALPILLSARFNANRSGFLLASHVFMVTLGYTTTFLVGMLGICFVGQRCFSDFSPGRVRSITRVTFVLGCVAAILTALAIILGMVWAKAESGRYWAWDPKETGALCVVGWLICFLALHRSRRMTARGVLVMSVVGNIVVSLGWFGANLFDLHWRWTTRYSISSYSWFLLAAVMSHLAVFLLGWAPAGWLRPRKIA